MSMMIPVQDYFKPREGNNQGLNIVEGQSMYKPLFNDRQGNNQGLNVEEGAVINPVTAQPPQQKVQLTPQEITSQIFADPPAPKYDKARQDRIKQIGKVVALGEGLKALGDVFALNRGALVPLRQQNQDPRNLYMAWQGYEDQYNNRMDEYNRQLFNTKLQALYRNEDRDYRLGRDAVMDERYGKEQEYRTSRDAVMDQRYKDNRDWIEKTWGSEQEWKDKMFKADQYWKKMGYNLNQRQKAAYDLMSDQLRYANQLRELEKDKFQLYTPDGKPIGRMIDMKKGELDAAFAILMKDPAVSGEIDALQSAFGDKISDVNKRYLLAKYGPTNRGVMDFVGGYEKGPQQGPMNPFMNNTSPIPQYNGPIAPSQEPASQSSQPAPSPTSAINQATQRSPQQIVADTKTKYGVDIAGKTEAQLNAEAIRYAQEKYSQYRPDSKEVMREAQKVTDDLLRAKSGLDTANQFSSWYDDNGSPEPTKDAQSKWEANKR